MKRYKTLIQYLLIILGSFIMGFAIKSIYDPAGLVTGGVSGVDATGLYSGKRRKMLICVVSPREIVTLRDIVRHYDRDAFVIIDDVREVFGEGFIEDLY